MAHPGIGRKGSESMDNQAAWRGEAGPWARFFSEAAPPDPALYREHIAERTILVTGAGGWIGSALCAALAHRGAKHLVLFDLAEAALYEAHRELSGRSPVHATPVLGSVCDATSLRDVIARYRPHVIYHAAAYKHVPLAERNPFAVLENNALGTETLAAVAAACDVPQVIMVSTDKAVEPTSVMGASKRIGELALFRHNHRHSMRALRLGNVFGSPGSVAPLFQLQIESGGPVTVTHPEARRYFMTPEDVTEYLLAALAVPHSCDLLAPELGDTLRVADLARHMIGDRDVPIVFDGLRPGDKLEESLLAKNESLRDRLLGGLYSIESPYPLATDVDEALLALRQAIAQRDLNALIAIVQQLVPGYRPSPLIRDQLVAHTEVHS